MGMFDEVECEIPLPGDGAAADRVFQTKSLHCALDRYTITQEGRLIHHFRRYERDPDVAPGVLGIPRMIPVDKQDIERNSTATSACTGRKATSSLTT